MSKTHTVVQGDTINSIAQRYDLEQDGLLKSNPQVTCADTPQQAGKCRDSQGRLRNSSGEYLYIGDQLYLPLESDCWVTKTTTYKTMSVPITEPVYVEVNKVYCRYPSDGPRCYIRWGDKVVGEKIVPVPVEIESRTCKEE